MAAAIGLSLGSTAAMADEYPDRPISLTVAYGAGGATDFQARIVTMMSAKEDKKGYPVYRNGQPMVILNRPGAGGQVGWNRFVDRAKPDGYELAAYNVPHFIAQSIVFPGKVKYNIDNLEPIANWGADPAVLIVNKDSPFNSVQDVIDYAKANPGKLTISGAGLYVGHHIANLQFDKAAPSSGSSSVGQIFIRGIGQADFTPVTDPGVAMYVDSIYIGRSPGNVLDLIDVERVEVLRGPQGTLFGRNSIGGAPGWSRSAVDPVVSIRQLTPVFAARTIGLRHLDVQLIGGAVLLSGMVAEMEDRGGKDRARMPLGHAFDEVFERADAAAGDDRNRNRIGDGAGAVEVVAGLVHEHAHRGAGRAQMHAGAGSEQHLDQPHAVGSTAAARQADGVDGFHQILRRQEIGLPRSGCGAERE